MAKEVIAYNEQFLLLQQYSQFFSIIISFISRIFSYFCHDVLKVNYCTCVMCGKVLKTKCRAPEPQSVATRGINPGVVSLKPSSASNISDVESGNALKELDFKV